MRSYIKFRHTTSPRRYVTLALTTCLLSSLMVSTASAQQRDRINKPAAYSVKGPVKWKAPTARRTVVKPKTVTARRGIIAPRRRNIGSLVVYRPYGPTIYGYGFHYTDAVAARWIGFTAITLALLDHVNEDQVRYHEQAQIEAASAPLGEAIVWQSGNASGSVTALREGVDVSGYTCREFQQSVVIDGQVENAYGTACLQADGSWRVVQ